jgi:hypothetical protein
MRAGRVNQVVEHLPSKRDTLSSSPVTPKKKKIQKHTSLIYFSSPWKSWRVSENNKSKNISVNAGIFCPDLKGSEISPLVGI